MSPANRGLRINNMLFIIIHPGLTFIQVVYDLHNTKGLMSRLRGYAAAKSMKTLTTEAIKAADILTKAAEVCAA